MDIGFGCSSLHVVSEVLVAMACYDCNQTPNQQYGDVCVFGCRWSILLQNSQEQIRPSSNLARFLRSISGRKFTSLKKKHPENQ